MRICKREDRVNPGSRFGRLVAIGEPFFLPKMTNSKRQPLQYLAQSVCQCDCGRVVLVLSSALKTGNTTSCGCKRLEHSRGLNRTHGLSTGESKRIYGIWKSMKSRCYDSRCGSYFAYGMKGIRVCDGWLSSVTVFYKWAIENGYKNNLVIDRIDPRGNYCPENCQWITSAENTRKQRQDVIDHIDSLERENDRLRKLLIDNWTGCTSGLVM